MPTDTIFPPGSGPWIDVPFNAGDYTGSGAMIWTVVNANVLTHRFKMLSPDTMILQVSIENADIGGTANNLLLLNIPNNKQARNRTGGAILVANNTVENSGRYLVTPGGPDVLLFQQLPGTAWTAGLDVNEIEFMIIIEVEPRP